MFVVFIRRTGNLMDRNCLNMRTVMIFYIAVAIDSLEPLSFQYCSLGFCSAHPKTPEIAHTYVHSRYRELVFSNNESAKHCTYRCQLTNFKVNFLNRYLLGLLHRGLSRQLSTGTRSFNVNILVHVCCTGNLMG